ncbi:Crp/Fnr family transcriptional regulator [uncultured Clostridium sp.]|uniref:Crp/Fnr family transcriptional regulator n=1 Tax=uncultured Clostridium sp. TaxID=59620 RepID=UPI0026085A36|nr:Crp/Fnr family transcriptional regulator [uncultured Clostridium sp.]
MLNNLEITFLEENILFYKKLSEEEKLKFNENAYKEIITEKYSPSVFEKECRGLVIVVKGELRAFLNSTEGKEITLYKLLQGDACIFTASCIFNNINFNISIEVTEEAEIIVLPSKYVGYFQKSNGEFQKYLLHLTQWRMSEVMWLMEQILFTSFDKRLKEYLLEFNSKSIKITHNAIAKDLGTAREVVSRMLKHFENKGMIRIFRGGIEIIDLNKE